MKESLKQNYNRCSKALFACVSYQELIVTIFGIYFYLVVNMYDILIAGKVNCKLENKSRLKYLRQILFHNLLHTAHRSYVLILKTVGTTALQIFCYNQQVNS